MPAKIPGKTKELVLLCSYCRIPLNESQMFEFRNWVACENCVRDYYRERPAEEVETQLEARKKNARTWLERNRKALEKHTSRKGA
jgi:hypothetical protein